ncbi:hypothetical protein CCM_00645 [Cordyceps militaris CM01]|uniref:Uncharacterized protein n=1 Tax=Cordyceps militaris (strain CM01) TaxID=983644 RepID=G3J577_CORMM|nr:uncharacterized protein CCM_00645 [Cordyceps militaris CM01]EGX95991.1 hypothetical protein CCM_00645 [Cordyceps militaris CM01]
MFRCSRFGVPVGFGANCRFYSGQVACSESDLHQESLLWARPEAIWNDQSRAEPISSLAGARVGLSEPPSWGGPASDTGCRHTTST